MAKWLQHVSFYRNLTMKSKHIFISLLATSLMNVACADSMNSACITQNGADPLVGVWYGSFTSDPGTDHEYQGYGTVTIHADGTAMAGDTTNTGGLGNLATAPTGVWEKLSSKHYQMTAMTIYSSMSTIPAPTSPVYTFLEHANIKLSDDCMTITSYDDTYGVFLPSDASFSHPLSRGTLHQTYTRVTQLTGKK
jgi:hypothetical protein